MRSDTYLLYGDTGSGKTAQIGELAIWEWEKTGKITRLISADSGWGPIEHLIISPDNPPPLAWISGAKYIGGGIIEAWDIQYVKNPFAVTTKLSEGEWPVRNDLTKGLVLKATSPEHWATIGQYAVEGISTVSELLLATHSRKQTKLSQDVSYQYTEKVAHEVDGKVIDEALTYANVAMSHYGDVQNRVLLDLVPKFAALNVARVIWTGHEAKGDDQVTGVKKSVLGPATAGTAAVGRTVKKFGDSLHLVKTVEKGKLERRAYYQDHPDEDLPKKLWPTNTRVKLADVAALEKKFPGGFIPLTPEKGLKDYFDFKYSK